VEERLLAELRDGVDAVAVEEVVEEERVVAREVEVAGFSGLLEGGEKALLEEVDAVVGEERLEFHGSNDLNEHTIKFFEFDFGGKNFTQFGALLAHVAE